MEKHRMELSKNRVIRRTLTCKEEQVREELEKDAL
jgi:hypothetical protein